MRNFVFHNPVKIIFGRDTISKIGPETACFGKKALLVYGRGSIKRNGIYRQVIHSLREARLEVIEHGGVRSNPVLGHVREGIALARKNKVEVIVAVGGGSVIDTAKAISAGAVVEHNVWKFFTGRKSVSKTLPVTCVLTLAASGSEMNSAMVITNEEENRKFGFAHRLLFPKTSIMDPEATFSVPPDYTAYGAVDIIAHVLEFYFTTLEPDTPVQDRLIEGLVVNTMTNCERALEDPQDYQARANLMWCATLALNGMAAAGLGKVGFPMHMIEHSLSALYDTPHGAGLSVIIPAWLIHQSGLNPAKPAQFAHRVFRVETGSEIDRADEGIKRLTSWFAKTGCPTRLSDIGVPLTDIPKIAGNALGLGKIWRLRDYDQKRIEEILHLCARGSEY